MGNEMQIQTVSAERHLPRLLSLVSEHAKRIDPRLKPLAELALAEAGEALRSAGTDQFRNELTACLALTAPTGMGESDRQEWLKVAWGTLRDIPGDLLTIGCTAARRRADHPAKIVPIIMDEAEALLRQRRASHSAVLAAMAKMEDPHANEPRCTPEEARRIIEEVGLNIPADKPDTSHRGKPIAPDAEWYRAHGIDLDKGPEPQAEQQERAA